MSVSSSETTAKAGSDSGGGLVVVHPKGRTNLRVQQVAHSMILVLSTGITLGLFEFMAFESFFHVEDVTDKVLGVRVLCIGFHLVQYVGAVTGNIIFLADVFT